MWKENLLFSNWNDNKKSLADIRFLGTGLSNEKDTSLENKEIPTGIEI